ncbi:MAG: SDR family NAD(P)-dependent oxidoreductase [Phycisphaerales bacterium]|nr:SDR family NAD(P)-dependent oxidoreductase [Phycisphaerales bacterium]
MKFPAEIFSRLKSAYDGRRVCVTGGAGFIGGHLVDALHSVGAHVTVIDDLSNSDLEHLAGLIELEPDRIKIVQGSVLDDEALKEAVSGGRDGPVRTVFHLAAMGSVPRSLEQPQRTWSVNATGTLRVLEAARAAKASRVVLASSSSAYGEQVQAAGGRTPGAPGLVAKVETMLPSPVSPYAASKAAAELLCTAWSHSFGLSTIAVRYFNVFGPRQPAGSAYAAVVAAFARGLLAGEQPVIFGDGGQSRDFTYVGNAVLGTLLAGSSEREFRGEVVNIGTGRSTTVQELAEVMARLLGVPHIQPAHQPARPGDVRESLADISRARQLLGYEPVTDLEEGLAETVEWYKRALADA